MAPTLQYGRSKAHKITDDTDAQGCDVVVPLNAKFQQPIDQDLKHFPALGAFPHRQNDRLDPDAALSQGIRQPGKLRYSHIFVRNNDRSEEHTSELQSLMRISYAVFCLKKKNNNNNKTT